MGKNNFRRMMMFRSHENEKTPDRDRLEEERDRKERDLERRLRRIEEQEAPRRAWRVEEQNRYIDPYPMPRYPDAEDNGRRMPRIGFSQSGAWEKSAGPYDHSGADSRSIRMPRAHLTHDEAEEWCDRMANADGTKGPHWTLEQTADVAKQRNIDCDKVDFWAAMNMMYSDYCKVAKMYSVDNQNFYADLAAAFLRDKDAVTGKLVEYWDCIVEHE